MGRWLKIEHGNLRCTSCGAFPVPVVWRWFDGEATWRHDWCESCVEKKLNEKEESHA